MEYLINPFTNLIRNVGEIMKVNNKITVANEDSLRGKVFSQLENDILNGVYKAGESFTESRVAEDLGVSRTPVREAIRQLELEGLVSYIPNKGATVNGLTKEDVQDIGEIRMKIEGIAARRASVKITKQQIAELEEVLALEAFHTERMELSALLQLDSRFHDIIFIASGSRLLGQTLRQFHHYLQQVRDMSMQSAERAEKTLVEHRSIFEAIKNGMSEQAEMQMVHHVKNATKNIQRMQSSKEE